MSEIMRHYLAKIDLPAGQVRLPFTATSTEAAQHFVENLDDALRIDRHYRRVDLLGPWETP